MPDTFDPYREALVVETDTQWPEELGHLSLPERSRIAAELHAHPDAASHLEYIRTHTGFIRRIVAEPADVARVSAT